MELQREIMLSQSRVLLDVIAQIADKKKPHFLFSPWTEVKRGRALHLAPLLFANT